MQRKQNSLKSIVSDDNTPFIKILAEDQLLHLIRNQDSLLPQIFTGENTKQLISYITMQHPLIEQNPQLSYKLPYMAMEVLCCECHHITQLIFKQEGESQQEMRPVLFEYLLTFLEYKEHYLLAGYFTRVIIAITKRVFSATHKYNRDFCKQVFENKNLLKVLNHMYSGCANDFIIKWLTLKGKDSNYSTEKSEFLQKLIRLINGQEEQIKNWGKQSRQTGVNLIMLLLRSSLQPPPPTPQPAQHKNTNLTVNKTSQKQLYFLITQSPCIQEIMKPVSNPNIQKINLVKRMIILLKTENKELQKLNEEYDGPTMSMFLSQEMLIQCFIWANECIIEIIEGSQKVNKVKIISILELLYQLHLLPEMKEKVTEFYEQKETQHVQIIVKLLKLKNNIIQNNLSKVILLVLEEYSCPDFSRVLLHEGLSRLFDEEGIREHILKWAKIILNQKNEKVHVFESVQEQSKWQHMTEVIHEAQLIQIGHYRHNPSPLNIFYSLEKIKLNYDQFLEKPVEIQYEDKSNPMKKAFSSPPAQLPSDNIIIKNVKKVQPENQKEIQNDGSEEIVSSWQRAGYLRYDLKDLLNEL